MDNDHTKVVAGVFIVLAVIIGLIWVLAANDYSLSRVFRPMHEQVRHDTFKQSQAYNDGMKQELYSMQREYISASPEHKAALRSIILHRVDSYDVTKLPQDLQDFINQLRSEQ